MREFQGRLRPKVCDIGYTKPIHLSALLRDN